jgi:dephospho-CoA kinase
MADSRAPGGKLVIGVTGGIGSGKSSAARLFAEHGAGLVDTDAVALALTQPGQPAMREIAQRFGAEYLTPSGALDRPRMRERAFSDPEAKRALEGILHPLIRAEVAKQVKAAQAPYVLVLIPLLVEIGGSRELVERVLVVDVDEEVQIARTMARSALSEEQVRAIMRTQASRERRLAAADDIIDNNGDLEALRTQVHALHGRYLQMASAAGV